MALRRRTLLIAGGGALAAVAGGVGLVEVGALPGRTRLRTALGLTGPDGVIPDGEPGPRITGEFASAARRGRTVAWTASYPPGAEEGDPLPVVVYLHGRHGDHRQG